MVKIKYKCNKLVTISINHNLLKLYTQQSINSVDINVSPQTVHKWKHLWFTQIKHPPGIWPFFLPFYALDWCFCRCTLWSLTQYKNWSIKIYVLLPQRLSKLLNQGIMNINIEIKYLILNFTHLWFWRKFSLATSIQGWNEESLIIHGHRDSSTSI